MKRYIKYNLVFLILALVGGVFYREFSKYMQMTSSYATLGLVHPHFLVLGVILILVFGLVTLKMEKENNFFSIWGLRVYSLGVLGTGIMLFIRGLVDMLVKGNSMTLSSGGNTVISVFSGLFHIVLGVGLVFFFVSWLKKDKAVSDSK